MGRVEQALAEPRPTADFHEARGIITIGADRAFHAVDSASSSGLRHAALLESSFA